LLFCLLLSSPLHAQEVSTLSGYVLDASNGEALIAANIYLEDTQLGAATNLSGYYVIPNIPPGTYVVVCSYLGYRSQRETVTINGVKEQKLNIVLEPELFESEAITVTADSIPISQQLYEKEISQVKLSPLQINSIPQIAEADLLRSLQTLPGILPLSDFSSALYIRGGTPDQNLYLLDGTDVYNPEHAFGLFSTFNTDAIKQVDLSKGGFGADQGGRLSSIISVTNLDGNREEFEGKASISLLSAKTTLQMPLGESGSFSASLRRTYFDQTIARFIDDIPNYYFYDGNAKAFWDIDDNNHLYVSFYGGRDVLDFKVNNSVAADLGFLYDWGNETGSIKWTHLFGSRLFANFWLTGSRFSSFLNFEGFDASEENTLLDLTAKGSLEFYHTTTWHSDFGFERKHFDVRFLSLGPGREVRVKTTPVHSVGYLQSTWRPQNIWDISAGLRFNHFSSDKDFVSWEPRFSVKYRVDTKQSVKFATGTYHQFLHRIPRFLIADIWTTTNSERTYSKSNHYILGWQRELPQGLQLEVEAFYKDYKDIYSFNQTFLTDLEASGYNENDEPVFTSGAALLNRGDGISRGFEVLLRKDTGVLNGWAGYSLAYTNYWVDDVNQDREFQPRHDRRHTVNLVANIDLDNAFRLFDRRSFRKDSSSWSLGINFIYASGQPFTEPGSGYFIGSAPGTPVRDVYFAPTQINQIRLPYYSRLDLSVTWQKQFNGWRLIPYLQIFNIGNRSNVWFATYDFEDGQPTLAEQYMFPLLPTIGVNVEF